MPPRKHWWNKPLVKTIFTWAGSIGGLATIGTLVFNLYTFIEHKAQAEQQSISRIESLEDKVDNIERYLFQMLMNRQDRQSKFESLIKNDSLQEARFVSLKDSIYKSLGEEKKRAILLKEK